MRLRWPIPLLVAGHTALLAAYTLPADLVPLRTRALAIAYVRPLFHQQWRLFAPDPPLCSCQLQVTDANGRWVGLGEDHPHYLYRRMVRGMAWNVQRGVVEGHTRVEPVIAEAIGRLLRDQGSSVGPVRLVERCITDPEQPYQREERITPLVLR
jgi:hypothetical protein